MNADVKEFLSSLRSQIFDADDIPSRDVPVPKWNVTLRIMGMSAQEQYSMLQGAINQQTRMVDFSKMYPAIVTLCTHAILPDGTTGPRVFERADAEMLSTKAAVNIEMLAKAAMELSGMRDNGELDTENSK